MKTPPFNIPPLACTQFVHQLQKLVRISGVRLIFEERISKALHGCGFSHKDRRGTTSISLNKFSPQTESVTLEPYQKQADSQNLCLHRPKIYEIDLSYLTSFYASSFFFFSLEETQPSGACVWRGEWCTRSGRAFSTGRGDAQYFGFGVSLYFPRKTRTGIATRKVHDCHCRHEHFYFATRQSLRETLEDCPCSQGVLLEGGSKRLPS